MVSSPRKCLQVLLADEGGEDVTGLEHYPSLAVVEPSQELTRGLKTKSLNADGSSHHILNWTFTTRDNLNVFLELKVEVRTHKVSWRNQVQWLIGCKETHGARLEQLESLFRMTDNEKEHLPHLLSMLELDRLSHPASGYMVDIASLQLDYTEVRCRVFLYVRSD
jgi:hypothetical protein